MVIKINVKRGNAHDDVRHERKRRRKERKEKKGEKKGRGDEIEIEPRLRFIGERRVRAQFTLRKKICKVRERALTMSFDLLVRSVNVLAGAVSARVPVAFVDVVRAIRTRKAGCTRALVAVLKR